MTGAHAIDLLLHAELTQGALSVRDAGLTEASRVFKLVAAGVGKAIADTSCAGVAGARRVLGASALDAGASFCASVRLCEHGFADALAGYVRAIGIGRARAASAGNT